jgi:hypothetical protein
MGDGIEQFQNLRLAEVDLDGVPVFEPQTREVMIMNQGAEDEEIQDSGSGSGLSAVDGNSDWVDFEAEFAQSTQTHSKRFAYYLESGTESDLTFLVGKDRKTVKAHKLILSIGSPVLRDLFQADRAKDTFEVPDMEVEDFMLFLKVRHFSAGQCILCTHCIVHEGLS